MNFDSWGELRVRREQPARVIAAIEKNVACRKRGNRRNELKALGGFQDQAVRKVGVCLIAKNDAGSGKEVFPIHSAYGGGQSGSCPADFHYLRRHVVLRFRRVWHEAALEVFLLKRGHLRFRSQLVAVDRKSTRLNSSHANISYAV